MSFVTLTRPLYHLKQTFTQAFESKIRLLALVGVKTLFTFSESFSHHTGIRRHAVGHMAHGSSCKMPKNNTVRAVLVDLSGTLHIEDTVIGNATTALKRLRESGILVKFVTNTTKESKRSLHERLVNLGFVIGYDEIFTSLTAARNVVQSRNLRPLLFLEDGAKEDFAGIPEDNPDAVVIGLAPSMFDCENLTTAFRLLLDGASLIAIHKARYYKKKDGLHLGPGAFVTGLEYAAGVKADVVGKPEKMFFMEAVREFNVDASDCVMIGDDVRDDVGGAMQAGMKGILVRTGKYREGDEQKVAPAPTATCDDFSSAVQYILDNMT